MMSVVFTPARCLPPCGFSSARRSLAVRAARRFAPAAAPDSRPSIPSILRTLNSNQGSVTKVLESQSQYFRSSDGLALLEGLGKQNKWTLTLEVFRWMQEQKWYKHDDGFYSKLIVIMGKAKQLRMAVWLFNEVKRTGSRPDTSLYNALITAYLDSKDKGRGFEKALRLLEDMKKRAKCQPNLVTYNILLRASAAACDVERVQSFFKEMEGAGIYPDLVSYNGVIGAYGKAGDYVQMERTLFVMRMQKHIKPDHVTSNTLIESYGRGKDFGKMEQVLTSMSSAQSRHKPDVKTYNIVMSNYARAGEVEKMEWTLERMEAASNRANVRSYEILMTGYGNVGAFSKMRACFFQLLEAGVQPQLSTLNVMLGAYCQHNAFEEAEELLSNAGEWQIRPRTSSYLIILRAYAKDNRLSDMERVVERMKIAGVAPSSSTSLEILESFGLSEPAADDEDEGDVVNVDGVAAVDDEDEGDVNADGVAAADDEDEGDVINADGVAAAADDEDEGDVVNADGVAAADDEDEGDVVNADDEQHDTVAAAFEESSSHLSSERDE